MKQKEDREDSVTQEFKMLNRIEQESREKIWLSEYATKSAGSKGRLVEEPKCELRTEFQRDRDRIIHSKAFRRLMHKTQVFLGSEGDHYRTRLTHTLEVSQISRTICRALRLNEDLAEAIALGHDLGHTPFGHNGEYILDSVHKSGFKHNIQSLRVVDVLETRTTGRGLNLTFEVRDGIRNHSGDTMPLTTEAEAVRLSDRIAYINHDIDDAIRSGVICLGDLPKNAIAVFGNRHSERINNMVLNVISHSENSSHISMDDEHMQMLSILRKYMFQNVYSSPLVKHEEDLVMVEKIITSLYEYFTAHPDKLPTNEQILTDEFDLETVVKDYIAGMTDRFAINTYENILKK